MKLLLLALSLLIISFSSYCQPGDLLWEDNFNLGVLDTTKWSYEMGTGVNGDWGTGQLDRATERVENVSFQEDIPGAEDACLVISTRKEFYIDRNYTSGRIRTVGKASWGPRHRIVAKVFPRDVKDMGQGFAFWMMPDEIPEGWTYIMWPQGGEVDIMEYVGSIPYNNLGSVHYAWVWDNNQWKDWNHGHQGAYYSYEDQEVPFPSEPGYGGYPPELNDPNAGSSGFHTYGIDWYDDRMEFFVDDNVYHIHYLNDGGIFAKDGEDQFNIRPIDGRRVATSEYSNHFEEWYPFEHKMYLILSGGVGGGEYTYGGPISSSAIFPCSVFIDWVRVYQLGYPIGVEEENQEPAFNIFPNPTQDQLHIQIDYPEDYSIRIADISGRTVLRTSLDQSASIDISSLKKGIYIVLAGNGKITLSRKIVIQ